MKTLTPLERVRLQTSIMDRLNDVFSDFKNDIEITPEFIQNTLEKYMLIATGYHYYLSRSVRLGEGELQQCSTCANWEDDLPFFDDDDEEEENLSSNTERSLKEAAISVSDILSNKQFSFLERDIICGATKKYSTYGLGEINVYKNGSLVGVVKFRLNYE
ncbi:hypothetical protein [Xenorhabdus cabanillasii]|uniref:Uncharacterized protein n=2 Tax=Xenorhabdus cabanillasii TaxID=351673 RepID=W1J3I5_9GAMM|nr:hypothetical protein [Xenorhabdus cabanillasii]PHM75454.1 hypothetical protein Xcab_04067 [Xenorhabdus cabanillasii JM26]CDL84628.1 hypothetical protein XCR1_2020006 [Xenorhabdus cabanillasii JM26]